MLGRKQKVPPPVSVILAVLDDLWLPYGLGRDNGLDPDAALDAALATLLVQPQLDEALAYMRGELDDTYHLSGEQTGRSFRQATLDQAGLIYEKLRLLPDWPAH